MKYCLYFIRWIFVLAVSLYLGSCAEDGTSTADQRYGYLQFHLAKKSTRAELDYLSDASKIRVDLIAGDGAAISQTLVISALDNATAEYGMQSEKWTLLAGEYQVAGYELYDALEQPLLRQSFDAANRQSLRVVAGGVSLHEILVNAKGYGTAQFRLVKDNAKPQTRVDGVKKYPFHQILFVNVTVKCLDDNTETVIKKMATAYQTQPSGDDPNHFTGVSLCDSLVTLPAGTYRVIGFETYFDKACTAKLAERSSDVSENSFVVENHKQTIADVPITLDEAAEYIKDAYALREIWLALDGPNWAYRGKDYPMGANWEFEGRDIDLWLAQPGVSILETGRVASLSLAGFGAKGDMPAALGQLTEMRTLYLGTHNNDLAFSPSTTVTEEQLEEQRIALRRSFTENFVTNGHPLEILSPELQEAAELNNISIKRTARPLQGFPIGKPVNYMTEIRSLPDEIGNLKVLRTLFVAHGPMKTLPKGLAKCDGLVDIEIFLCPEMKEFPPVLAEMPKLSGLIFSCNAGVTSEKMIEGLRYMNKCAGERGESRLQIFQMPAQPIEFMPDIRNLESIGMLSIQQCGIKYFEKAFGKEHLFVQFIANDNEVESLPVDEDGYFVGLHNEFELMTFSRNKFTELPNIFDAQSRYTLGTMDFSFNQITKLQGSDDGTWRGIKLNIFNLGFNRFKEFPKGLYTEDDKCSQVSYLMLQGNNMETIPEEALVGKRTAYLISFDLSRNKLTELPKTFNAENFPYIFGLDMSYNRFPKFEFKPLNSASLTTYVFRGQRDEKGNRCMKEWPTGIGSHKGMRALYLGSNDIRKVTDNNLSYMIFNLEILDNPNISIDISKLCPAIRARQFRLAYDPTQDIRGCDVLELE